MAATLFEMKDKLEFYNKSPSMMGVVKEKYCQWIKRLVKIQKSIGRNKKFDSRPIVSIQGNLQIQESLKLSLSLLKKTILNLFPSFMHPILVRLYKKLYSKFSNILYMKKI